ncbi:MULTISPECIES: esterase family protein [Aerococcus]|uniref:esterase family protein n=1 Tax=Aerococcus TaxID=1375 RepID=UPI0018A752C8|nr:MULTISPECIES: alpha/beta hydrolase-fold protein [Aerococcus]MCY3035787.1 alpha/beta hydrolase-fold protein [Aerococcus sp. Group 2]MCY3040228.1 alpha/beta hydrolase-fold protein [Aerococcus sp. Group 2]MCY3040455.1 alpha/beta hydrolase-fold protein [Aerococcus sp. Group 2]MCY3043621.1 alpha/beta hydrolase-fold protein [Aerococcus sp. Group 2]MDK6519899.1 alpha/beta hydrolase-fold protein [Aerococcus urinae]
MNFESYTHYGHNIGRNMSINRYGHAGKPFLVFPSSGGSHNEYADFGMIEACQAWIDNGKLQFFTLSSYDDQSWLSNKSGHDMALAQQAYDRYFIEEALPLIKHVSNWMDPMGATGCSMGAYHAINTFLNHPDVIDTVIALSGVYDVRYFMKGYQNDFEIYHNSPVDFLWGQNDPWFIDHYRQGDIIVCTGLGPWEEDGLPSFYSLKAAFECKQIPAWFDTWGEDVAHDWPWWRKQMPYFLQVLYPL